MVSDKKVTNKLLMVLIKETEHIINLLFDVLFYNLPASVERHISGCVGVSVV